MFQRGRNPPLVTAITPFLSNHPYIRALCLSYDGGEDPICFWIAGLDDWPMLFLRPVVSYAFPITERCVARLEENWRAGSIRGEDRRY